MIIAPLGAAPGDSDDEAVHTVVNVNDPNLKGKGRVGRSVNRASSFFFFTDDLSFNQDHESLPSVRSQDQGDQEPSLLLRALERANDFSKTEPFHNLAVTAVLTYIVMSLTEILMVLLVLPENRTALYYVALHGPMAFNASLMILFCGSMFVVAATCKVGFFGYFKSLWHIFDLLVYVSSTAIEILAIFLNTNLTTISLSILVLRIYSAFRTIKQLNRRLLQREARLTKAALAEFDSLIQEHDEIVNKGNELRQEIQVHQTKIENGASNMEHIDNQILEVKRNSWCTFVPPVVAANISSRRHSFISTKSMRSAASTYLSASSIQSPDMALSKQPSMASMKVSVLNDSVLSQSPVISDYNDSSDDSETNLEELEILSPLLQAPLEIPHPNQPEISFLADISLLNIEFGLPASSDDGA